MVWGAIAAIGRAAIPAAVGAAFGGGGKATAATVAARRVGKAANKSLKSAGMGHQQQPLPTAATQPSAIDTVKHELTSGRLVNALYSIDATMRMADRVLGLAKTTFHHSIVVAVKGGPAASMTRTWQLACALAFGQYRHAIGIASDVSVDATWDLSAKSVQITIFYQLGFQSELGARTFIQRGPIVETVGGGWPGFLTPGIGGAVGQALFPAQDPDNFLDGFVQGLGDVVNVGGIFDEKVGLLVKGGRPVQPGEQRQFQQALLDRRAALVNAGLQGQFDVLPDEGRLILTEIKDNPYVQPPAPDDYGDLISLVANTLTDPGFQPSEPPPGPRFGNSDGAQLYDPGFRITDSVINGRLRELQNVGLRGIVGGVLGIAGAAINFGLGLIGKDGYTKRNNVPSVQGPNHDGY